MSSKIFKFQGQEYEQVINSYGKRQYFLINNGKRTGYVYKAVVQYGKNKMVYLRFQSTQSVNSSATNLKNNQSQTVLQNRSSHSGDSKKVQEELKNKPKDSGNMSQREHNPSNDQHVKVQKKNEQHESPDRQNSNDHHKKVQNFKQPENSAIISLSRQNSSNDCSKNFQDANTKKQRKDSAQNLKNKSENKEGHINQAQSTKKQIDLLEKQKGTLLQLNKLLENENSQLKSKNALQLEQNTQLKAKVQNLKIKNTSIQPSYNSLENEKYDKLQRQFQRKPNQMKGAYDELQRQSQWKANQMKDKYDKLQAQFQRKSNQLNRVFENKSLQELFEEKFKLSEKRHAQKINKLAETFNQQKQILESINSSCQSFNDEKQRLNRNTAQLTTQKVLLTFKQDFQKINKQTSEQMGNVLKKIEAIGTNVNIINSNLVENEKTICNKIDQFLTKSSQELNGQRLKQKKSEKNIQNIGNQIGNQINNHMKDQFEQFKVMFSSSNQQKENNRNRQNKFETSKIKELLSRQKQALNNRIKQGQQQIKRIKRQRDTNQTTIDQLNKQKKVQQSQINELKQKVAYRQNQLQDIKKQLDLAKKKVINYEQQRNQLLKRNQSIQQFRSDCQKYRNQKNLLKASLSDAQQQTNRLKQQLRQQSQKFTNLQISTGEVQKTLMQAQKDTKQREGVITAIKNQLNKLSTQQASYKCQQGYLKDQFQSIVQKMKGYKIKLSEKQSQRQEIRKLLQKYKIVVGTNQSLTKTLENVLIKYYQQENSIRFNSNIMSLLQRWEQSSKLQQQKRQKRLNQLKNELQSLNQVDQNQTKIIVSQLIDRDAKREKQIKSCFEQIIKDFGFISSGNYQSVKQSKQAVGVIGINKNIIKNEIKKLGKAISQLKTTSLKKQQSLKQLSSTVEKLDKEIINLKSQRQTMKGQIKNLEDANKELKMKYTNAQEQLRASKLRQQRMASQLRNQATQVSNIKQELAKQKKQHRQKVEAINQLEERIKQYKSKIQRQNQEAAALSSKKLQLEQQLRILNGQKQQLEQQLRISKNDKSQIERQLQTLKNDKSQVERQLQTLKTAYKNLEDQKRNYQENLHDLKLEHEQKARIIAGRMEALFRKTCDKQQIRIEPSKIAQQIEKYSIETQRIWVRRLCPQSVILRGQDPQKIRFLTNTIESEKGKKIVGCQMLYRFDPLNKITLHHYVDNRVDLLLLIKTVDGFVLGSFIENVINEIQVPGKGFLFSVTNKFKLNLTTRHSPNARVSQPDQFNMIYGNIELRIKVQSDICFSNLGLVASYFDSIERGIKVNDLLGGGPGVKEVKMEVYQYYQLRFA